MNEVTEILVRLDRIIELLEGQQKQENPKRNTVKPASVLTDDEQERILMLVKHYSANPGIVRLTASEIAAKCDIHNGMAELQAIGKVVMSSGYDVQKRRSGGARCFVFSCH